MVINHIVRGKAQQLTVTLNSETQRSVMDMRALDLVPVAEFQLTTDTIRKFRTGYVAMFGAAGPDDLLYEAVSDASRARARIRRSPSRSASSTASRAADAPRASC